MGYARLLAIHFRFTESQKARVLQLANYYGIPDCIENSDSYFRRGTPDILSSSPVTQCDWYVQYLREEVFALISAEQRAAAGASYDEFSREVAGKRRALELNSKRRR